MNLLQPGTTENLNFSKESTMTPEGSLKLVMETTLSDVEMRKAFEEDRDIDSSKSGFIIYPPNMLDFDSNPKTAKTILGELNDTKKRFLEYGELFGPREEAQKAFGGFKLFEGLTPIDNYTAFIETLDVESVAIKVSQNLSKKFLAFIQTIPNLEEVKFRHKFYRQSKKKHYAIIPFYIKGVIVESMEVPLEATKISWSEWELEHGKNNSAPAAADISTKDTVAANALFSPNGESEPAPHLESSSASNELY